jgi:hypothetical protein
MLRKRRIAAKAEIGRHIGQILFLRFAGYRRLAALQAAAAAYEKRESLRSSPLIDADLAARDNEVHPHPSPRDDQTV